MLRFVCVFALLVGVALSGCVSEQTAAQRPISAAGREHCTALRQAYRSLNPERGFDAYFQAWHRRGIRPPDESDRSRMDDTLRAAYEIAEIFYSEHFGRKGKIGRVGYHDDVVQPTRYVVLSDTFYVMVNTSAIVDTTAPNANTPRRSVPSFRPRIPFRFASQRIIPHFRPTLPEAYASKDLYLTDLDGEAFECFLGLEHSYGSSIMSTAVPHEPNQRRAEALTPYLTVIPGHWGGWKLLSQPSTGMIVFAPDLQSALLSVSDVYVFGSAYFERKNGAWQYRSLELYGAE